MPGVVPGEETKMQVPFDIDDFNVRQAISAFRFRTKFAYAIPEANDYNYMVQAQEFARLGLSPIARVKNDTAHYVWASRLNRF